MTKTWEYPPPTSNSRSVQKRNIKEAQLSDDWTNLFGVEGVELCLAVLQSPQTEHLRLGAVRHVDELLVPPAITDGASDAAQDEAVVTHLSSSVI